MRIDSLHLGHFRGFEDRSFEFPRSIDAPAGGNGSFHVILGHNGKGKTTVLEGLAVAASAWVAGVCGEDSRHILPGDIRRVVRTFEDTERIEATGSAVVSARGIICGHNVEWRRERRATDGARTTRAEAEPARRLAEDALQALERGEEVTLPVISYYGTGRRWLEPRDRNQSPAEVPEQAVDPGAESDQSLADSFASRLAGYRYSVDPRWSTRDLKRWFEFEQRIAAAESRESTQYRVVKEAVRRAVEGCTRVAYHPRLGLLLDIEGQPRLPFDSLSDGQRNIVALVGDLAIKMAQLNPHLGGEVFGRTPGIVLIDEIDLHLHPEWQRRIVEDLRTLFPEVQFIVTTHSPFVVQVARPGELIPLDAQPVLETGNLGIEAIASGLMGVVDPQVSPRYREMVGIARDYLTELELASREPEERLAEHLERLADAIAPYADNPAFQAFLELKREGKLGSRGRNGSTRGGSHSAAD